MSVNKIKLNNTKNINGKIYYNNKPYTGIIVNNFDSKTRESEIEYLEGIKHGLANYFNKNGYLIIQINFQNGLKHGKQYNLLSDGTKTKESYYQFGKHIKSYHFNKNGNEIKNLYWFSGDLRPLKLKIRKYYITNRYCFAPKLIWLDDMIVASIFSYLISLLHSNCNYELSTGGGGIRAMERKRDKETWSLEDLKFNSKESKKLIEDNILYFKKYFTNEYKEIFHDNTIEDTIELSKYMILNLNPFTYSSFIRDDVKEISNEYKNISTVSNNEYENLKNNLSVFIEFFNTKYLEISEGFSDNYKKFIILDKSVKPMGIVFDADSKSECEKWINKKINYKNK